MTKNQKKKAAKKRKKAKSRKKKNGKVAQVAKFPRHTIDQALRVPKAILDQNAGKECSMDEAAKYVGLGSSSGPFTVEISSSKKYGFLESQSNRKIRISDLAKRILRPQKTNDEFIAKREAVLKAPEISDVYNHYRGENLPDDRFFDNALVDTFKIPQNKISEFKFVFFDTLKSAQLLTGC